MSAALAHPSNSDVARARPAPAPRFYFSRDLAGLLGIGLETFYRNYGSYVLIDGMPRSITSKGRKVFDRASIDAWLGRHHPHAPQGRPANDTAPRGAPNDVDAQRDYLARAYAR